MNATDLETKHGDALVTAMLGPIDYAFQPIVSATSGRTHGVEALIRGTETLGFHRIKDYFDYAHRRGVLHALDLHLRAAAIDGFSRLPINDAVLFFNLDQRITQSPDYQVAQTAGLLSAATLAPERLVFELSEAAATDNPRQLADVLDAYRTQGYRLAIDDFGVGVSGFKLLFEHQPFYLKIEQYFVRGIDGDRRRRLFASSMAHLAHLLGISVIAEGVETDAELRVCREIGCNLVQGYFVSRPTKSVTSIAAHYPEIATLQSVARRRNAIDAGLIRDQIDPIAGLPADSAMPHVFEAFRKFKQYSYFPVIDSTGVPLGIVKEEDLKEYIYSVYGKDLLANPATGRKLRDFLSACPTAEIDSPIERVLQTYSLDPNPAGVMVLEDGRYAGMLSADSLLRIVNDKNLALARDQNPLTKLPGNLSVAETIERLGQESGVARTFAYFDLDHFKPFNDVYGFRLGDRAILLLAERLQSAFDGSLGVTGFVGHLGGDDFFAAVSDSPAGAAEAVVRRVLDGFASDVASFYAPDDRARGYIEGTDRAGRPGQFPLLTCSAALMHVPVSGTVATAEALAAAVAPVKKRAKAAADGLAVSVWPASLPDPGLKAEIDRRHVEKAEPIQHGEDDHRHGPDAGGPAAQAKSAERKRNGRDHQSGQPEQQGRLQHGVDMDRSQEPG